MNHHQDDIKDPELTTLLRRSLAEAPEAWVTDALSVPEQHALNRFIPSEPWLVVIAPHLAALALIAGLVLTLFVPTARAALAEFIPELHRHDPVFWTWAGFLTPFILLLLHQGARGFPVLRRFRH